jgi:hypothetical protein
MGTVSRCGKRSDGLIHGRRILGRSYARSAYLHLLHFQTRSLRQRLADAAHTSSAMHAIDMQREFRHNFPLLSR